MDKLKCFDSKYKGVIMAIIKKDKLFTGKVQYIEGDTVYVKLRDRAKNEYFGECKIYEFKNQDRIKEGAIFDVEKEVYENADIKIKMTPRTKKKIPKKKLEDLKQKIDEAFFEGDVEKLRKALET